MVQGIGMRRSFRERLRRKLHRQNRRSVDLINKSFQEGLTEAEIAERAQLSREDDAHIRIPRHGNNRKFFAATKVKKRRSERLRDKQDLKK